MDEHVGDGLEVKSEESVEVLETTSVKVKEESETISEDTPGYENITESPTLLTSNDEFEFDNLTVDERDNTGETFISNQIGTVFNPDEMVEDEQECQCGCSCDDCLACQVQATHFTKMVHMFSFSKL